MSIGLAVAFLAGMATFFSPCILPIIPGYLSVLSAGEKALIVRRAIFFSIGLGLVFTTLGLIVAWIGATVVGLRDLLLQAIGIVLVIYGIHLVRPLPIESFNKEWRLKVGQKEASDFNALVLGSAFGIAWTPCSGVILGAILAQALLFQSLQAAPLLFAFSLGLIVPMIALAVVYQRAGKLLNLPGWVGRYYNPVIGGLVIILGLSLIFGWINQWRTQLLLTIPNLESGLLPFTR